MNRFLRNSKVWNIIKKAIVCTLIGSMLVVSVPDRAYAQPKGGFIGKLTTFMVKEKIKDNKKKKIEEQRRIKEIEDDIKKAEREAKKEAEKEQREQQAKEYSKQFQHLNWEDLVGLGNLVDQMLDGYCKDTTDLSRKQLESRIKTRLKNKKLTKRHHNEIGKYIEKRIYLHQICEHEGEGFVVISPSGAITFTAPTPVLAY